ncbi:hypothetical protein UlMin_009954 [Ulmus minor]
MTATTLVGPPTADSPENDSTGGNIAMDYGDSQATNPRLTGNPPMGLTENLSPTLLSTGNPCLDFFFHVVPDTPPSDLIGRLEFAWKHEPLTTLKLICNLRGVRGTGKSDKEGFYAAAIWLHENHPKTLALNLRAIGDFGYFKDFPEILYRLLEGSDVRKLAKQEWSNRKRNRKRRNRDSGKIEGESDVETQISEKVKKVCLEDSEQLGGLTEKEKARSLRKEREMAKAKRALERYKNDPNYKLLYDCVCDVFAELLKLDLDFLNSGEVNKISLASKWSPSIDSSYDKCTLLCEGIAKRVFPIPKDCDLDYEGLEGDQNVCRIRDRLRKEVLVPLRKVLELPEVYMSANRWQSLPYTRVASVAMRNYKKLFQKHDKERFEGYLEDVESGKAKIAAGALLPHEIIMSLNDDGGAKVAELQWRRMVDDLAKKGKLSNCIAVCDVSGSMIGIPMEVCVALGLLVSELSEEPWKGRVITFSENPQLHVIKGDTLLAKTEFVRQMDWGGNTDFQKVFDRILEVAVEGKLSEEQLIKRVFVFSDMEFDQACFREAANQNNWETDYQVIQRKFREKGYYKVPEIVFWNLRDSSSTPVVANQAGVALLSGFSKNLLTLFLEEGGIVNPEDVMMLAIAGQEYKKLAVYD